MASSSLPKPLFEAPIILYRLMELGNSFSNCELWVRAFWNLPWLQRVIRLCSWSWGGSLSSELLDIAFLDETFIPSIAFLFLGNFLRISLYILLASSLRPSFTFFLANFNASCNFNSSKMFDWSGTISCFSFLTATDEMLSLNAICSKLFPFTPLLFASSNTTFASAIRFNLIKASM